MVPYGAICSHLVPYGTICAHIGPAGTIWAQLGPYGTIWGHMGPYGEVSCGFLGADLINRCCDPAIVGAMLLVNN